MKTMKFRNKSQVREQHTGAQIQESKYSQVEYTNPQYESFERNLSIKVINYVINITIPIISV